VHNWLLGMGKDTRYAKIPIVTNFTLSREGQAGQDTSKQIEEIPGIKAQHLEVWGTYKLLE
jgi:hypothetical protein